jgi:hypothetical protein
MWQPTARWNSLITVLVAVTVTVAHPTAPFLRLPFCGCLLFLVLPSRILSLAPARHLGHTLRNNAACPRPANVAQSR